MYYCPICNAKHLEPTHRCAFCDSPMDQREYEKELMNSPKEKFAGIFMKFSTGAIIGFIASLLLIGITRSRILTWADDYVYLVFVGPPILFAVIAVFAWDSLMNALNSFNSN